MPSPEYVVVDRIEGDIAVIVSDTGHIFDVPRSKLPRGSREGTVLRVKSAASPDWENAWIDTDEERRRDREAQDEIERLEKTDPGGDLQL